MSRRRRRRPLPGEGSQRLGTFFDRGLPSGDPEETLSLTVSGSYLSEYATELTALAVEYRRNLERGHLQQRDIVSQYLALPFLRAFWPFTSVDESRSVYDLSGQGRTLAASGLPVFGLVSGRLAPSVNFGSVNLNKHFSRADGSGLNWNGLSSFMVAGWVRPGFGATSSGVGPIVSKGDESTGVEYYVRLDLAEYRLQVAAGDEDYTAPLSRALSPSAWSFIAAGYDGSADRFHVYINGWHNTVQGNAPTLAATTDPFYVGRHDNGATVSRWRGELAMLAFFWEVLEEELLGHLFEGTRLAFGQ